MVGMFWNNLIRLIRNSLLIVVMALSLTQVQAKELTIKKVVAAPTIDGQISNSDPWNGIAVQQITEAKGITTDFSGQFKMCYNSEFIFVLVDVTDPNPKQIGDMTYNSDCVELFFAIDTLNTATNNYREGDWQIRKIAAKAQDEQGVSGSSSITNLLNNPKFLVKQTDKTGGYIQEWQIPISALDESAIFNGKVFRFDMQITQNDGTSDYRKGQLFWNSNADNQWTTIMNQGFIRLEEPLTKMIPLVTFTKSYLTLDTLLNSKDTLIVNALTDWTSEKANNWYSLSKAQGTSGTSSIIFNIDQTNAYAYDRNDITKIKWTQDGLAKFKSIHVHQNPVKSWLIIDTSKIVLSINGSKAFFKASHNSSGYVNDRSNWLNIVQDSVVGFTVYFSVIPLSANPLIVDRVGFLTFAYYNANTGIYEKHNVRVIQAASVYGSDKEIITLESGTNSVGTMKLKLSAPNFTINNSNTWFSVSPSSGTTTDAELTIKSLENNPVVQKREASFLISYTDLSGNAKNTSIAVIQNGETPYVTISKDTLIFDANGGIQQLNVSSNTSWNCNVNNWITTNLSAASGNATLNITAASNEYATERICNFSFVYHDERTNSWPSKNVLCIQKAALPKNIVIKNTAKAPKIDGIASNDESWANIERQNILCRNGIIEGFSANFKMSYDSLNIYVLVNVTDPNPRMNGVETYMSDCVELFFAMDTANSERYRIGDLQLRKIASRTQLDSGINISQFIPSNIMNDTAFKVVQSDFSTGYIQEWQIPISTLADTSKFNFKNLRFDIQVAQNDGTGNGRTGQLFWNSNSDRQWFEIKDQGFINFEKEVTPFISISSSKVTLPDSAKSASEFRIVSNSSWKMNNAADWITISTPNNIGNQTIKLVCTQNSKPIERKSVIKLTDKNLKVTQFEITQKAAPETLTVSKETIAAKPVGDTLKIEVKSNSKWKISNLPKWVKYTASADSANTSVTVVVEANKNSDRIDTFSFSNNTYTIDIIVTQAANYTQVQKSNIADFNIYPNPVKDKLNVNYNSNSIISSQIVVFDVNGRAMLKTQANNTTHAVIDVSSLNKGLYYISVIGADSKSSVLKFIKE